MKSLVYCFFILASIGCASPQESDSTSNALDPEKHTIAERDESSFVQKVEEAHHRQAFLGHDAISFDILLEFGGKERLNATVALSADSYKGKFQLADERSYYFVGDKVFVDPGYESPDGLRFSAYTWSYFFLLPYKLSDEGTYFAPYTQADLDGKTYEAEKLTFSPGTGDAPDDWYILYADPTDHLLQVASYIVTAGSSLKEAELDPHAIAYSGYSEIDGVPIAHKWTFWEWRETVGLTRQLGQASLSNIRFLDTNTDQIFEVPEDFLEI